MVKADSMNWVILEDICTLNAGLNLQKTTEYEKERNVWTSDRHMLAPNSESHTYQNSFNDLTFGVSLKIKVD